MTIQEFGILMEVGKIPCIKEVRSRTGQSLKEAKDLVDRVLEEHRLPYHGATFGIR